MMQQFNPEEAVSALRRYEGQTVYLHVETARGVFLRNIQAQIEQTYVAGDGPYRAALKLVEDGWIRVEMLTHQVLDEERVYLAGHDELGRLTTALQISLKPFPA